MENINKIIDSLNPGEQNVMYNALQKRLNRGPEYTIRKNGTGYSIKLNDKYENTQDSFADIIDNIKYVFRLLNINSEWAK